MSIMGDIKKASETGRKSLNKVMWCACIDCEKQRWVELRCGQPRSLRCKKCADKIRGATFTKRYKGIPHLGNGRRYDKDGYILILLRPDDFFYPMARKNGCVLEHRLVVARALGRCLQPWEIVHHKDNCPRDDNRYPETLQLVTDERHNQITILETRIARLEKRITLLEAENILLKQHERVCL